MQFMPIQIDFMRSYLPIKLTFLHLAAFDFAWARLKETNPLKYDTNFSNSPHVKVYKTKLMNFTSIK